MENAFPYVTERIGFISHKLMARIKLTPRRDCHVFGTRAAARDALVDTRTVFEVKHLVIEGKGSAFFLAFDHFLGENFILLKKDGKIFFG